VRSTGFHSVDGAVFVRAEGFPALVVSLVAYHTGAVFEARERGLSDALAEFAEPPDFLLDVLTCAHTTTGPDGSQVRADDRLSEILSRYAEDRDPVAVRRRRCGASRDHFVGACTARRGRSR
jgi:hypothetical protein